VIDEEKGVKSIPIGARAEGLTGATARRARAGCCIDTLALNGLALPPFFIHKSG
jgi:hypothetical protein